MENGKSVTSGFSLAHRKGVKASVKYKVIYHHKDTYSISEMCCFFEVSRSGYYDFVSKMDILAKDMPLAQMIQKKRSVFTEQNLIVLRKHAMLLMNTYISTIIKEFRQKQN